MLSPWFELTLSLLDYYQVNQFIELPQVIAEILDDMWLETYRFGDYYFPM
jgi:hypothetical protein